MNAAGNSDLPVHHYLLVYDLGLRRLVACEDFTDSDEAAQAYARKEQENRGNRGLEIVLVGADSLETIKVTHGHYFDEVDSDAAALSIGG